MVPYCLASSKTPEVTKSQIGLKRRHWNSSFNLKSTTCGGVYSARQGSSYNEISSMKQLQLGNLQAKKVSTLELLFKNILELWFSP